MHMQCFFCVGIPLDKLTSLDTFQFVTENIMVGQQSYISNIWYIFCDSHMLSIAYVLKADFYILSLLPEKK